MLFFSQLRVWDGVGVLQVAAARHCSRWKGHQQASETHPFVLKAIQDVSLAQADSSASIVQACWHGSWRMSSFCREKGGMRQSLEQGTTERGQFPRRLIGPRQATPLAIAYKHDEPQHQSSHTATNKWAALRPRPRRPQEQRHAWRKAELCGASLGSVFAFLFFFPPSTRHTSRPLCRGQAGTWARTAVAVAAGGVGAAAGLAEGRRQLVKRIVHEPPVRHPPAFCSRPHPAPVLPRASARHVPALPQQRASSRQTWSRGMGETAMQVGMRV